MDIMSRITRNLSPTPGRISPLLLLKLNETVTWQGKPVMLCWITILRGLRTCSSGLKGETIVNENLRREIILVGIYRRVQIALDLLHKKWGKLHTNSERTVIGCLQDIVDQKIVKDAVKKWEAQEAALAEARKALETIASLEVLSNWHAVTIAESALTELMKSKD